MGITGLWGIIPSKSCMGYKGSYGFAYGMLRPYPFVTDAMYFTIAECSGLEVALIAMTSMLI